MRKTPCLRAICAAAAFMIAVPSLSSTAFPATQPVAGNHVVASGWQTTVQRQRPVADPNESIIPLELSFSDERATLEALQFALNEVGDGSTFVWHRKRGDISGTIRPTASFRDDRNRVCRHLEFSLRVRDLTRRIEGIACRTGTGIWHL